MPLENVRLRSENVPLQWHEAVAVVQAVAKQLLASGDDGPVPTCAGLALDPDGAVQLLDSRGTGENGDGPAGLAALLRELLRGSSFTPAALNALADETEATSRFGSVEDFSKALHFFQRPMSPHDLAALAARFATIQEQRRLSAELDQLTQKARVGEVQPDRQAVRLDPRRASLRRKAAIAVLAVVFVAIAMLVATLAGLKRLEPLGLKEAGSRLVERISNEAQAVLASDAQPSPPRQPTIGSAAPPGAERQRSRRLNPPAAPSPLPLVDLRPVATGDVTVVVESPAISVARADTDEQPSARGAYIVYSRVDPDVDPPILTRPQLRTEPPPNVRADQIAVIEVVVDEQGGVGQVRLRRVSVEQRYYAAMLVAAAKAWRFRPARKAGKPVRYRLQFGVVH